MKPWEFLPQRVERKKALGARAESGKAMRGQVSPVSRHASPAKERPVLQLRAGDRADVLRSDVIWKDNYVEWQATPGAYELVTAGK